LHFLDNEYVGPLIYRLAEMDAAAAGLMVVIMENQQAINVLGNQNAPNITRLGQMHPVATQYFATTHPSLPNYLELWAGSTFGVTDDNPPADHPLTGATLGSQLDAAGISWAGYFESLQPTDDPTVNNGMTDRTGAQLYQTHHNPIVYFEGYDRARIKPFSALLDDLDSPAPCSFCLVVPNMADNMHDPVGSTAKDALAVQAGDQWVQGLVDSVTATAWWRNGGTIILIWDEAYNGSGHYVNSGFGEPPTNGGPVILMLISDVLTNVGPYTHGLGADGNWDSPLTHAGLFGSIESYFGLAKINDARNASYGDISPVLISSAAPGVRGRGA
jgi:hypothetical protein